MKFFWFALYNCVFLPIMIVTTGLLSLQNKKIRESVLGRFRALKKIKLYASKKSLGNKIFWFHVSSLGEFYQLKPIIEGLKVVDKDIKNIVSFSSPSGYKNAKSKALNLKIYIPIDFFWIPAKILKIIRPKKIIFVAYDLWPNLIWMAKKYKIHISVFALHFKKNHLKSKPVIKNFYKSLYGSLNAIYTVNQKDKNTVRNIIGKSKNTIIKNLGNPRFDMVINDLKSIDHQVSESILEREKRIIIGSTHPEDDSMIIPALSRLVKNIIDLKIIYVPHEPKNNIIDKINSDYISLGHDPIIIKTNQNGELPDNKIIIVNSVGLLAKLYWFGKIAFIGGGMSTGIHNIMEPAVAGLPVLFGPKYGHAPEAQELLNAGGGFCVNTGKEFEDTVIELFKKSKKMKKASVAAKKMIYDNIGSSDSIINGIMND